MLIKNADYGYWFPENKNIEEKPNSVLSAEEFAAKLIPNHSELIKNINFKPRTFDMDIVIEVSTSSDTMKLEIEENLEILKAYDEENNLLELQEFDENDPESEDLENSIIFERSKNDESDRLNNQLVSVKYFEKFKNSRFDDDNDTIVINVNKNLDFFDTFKVDELYKSYELSKNDENRALYDVHKINKKMDIDKYINVTGYESQRSVLNALLSYKREYKAKYGAQMLEVDPFLDILNSFSRIEDHERLLVEKEETYDAILSLKAKVSKLDSIYDPIGFDNEEMEIFQDYKLNNRTSIKSIFNQESNRYFNASILLDIIKYGMNQKVKSNIHKYEEDFYNAHIDNPQKYSYVLKGFVDAPNKLKEDLMDRQLKYH